MTDDKYQLKKQPVQERSRFMVEVIKEAAAHILRNEGLRSFTTNKVAERAGVSIGSLYQYFPSKESIIAEVKRDHFNELRAMFRSAYNESHDRTLAEIARILIDVSIRAHRLDPVLHKVLSGDLSEFNVKEDDHSDDSIRTLVVTILEQHRSELRDSINITLAADITYKIIEKIIHEAVIQNQEGLEGDEVADELHLLIMAYLTLDRNTLTSDGNGW